MRDYETRLFKAVRVKIDLEADPPYSVQLFMREKYFPMFFSWQDWFGFKGGEHSLEFAQESAASVAKSHDIPLKPDVDFTGREESIADAHHIDPQ